jgi:hypothetical protein
LLSGFASTGVDNAAHLGGLAAGFLLGAATAHPRALERRLSLSDIRRYAQTITLAIAFVGAGVWCAQRASLVGEGSYWHTIHWFQAGAQSADSKFNAALHLAQIGRLSEPAFADRLDSEVLPFWREASNRISAIDLAPSSPNLPALELFRSLSESKVRGLDLLAEGLRKNDPQEKAAAKLELERGATLIDEWQSSRR